MAANDDDAHLLYHPAIEVSLHSSIDELRQIAVAASPPADQLIVAQRTLLRAATARLARKGLSTDTETYRRLGILIPRWKHPDQFEATLYALQDYWQRHRTAKSLGCSAPFREVRIKAAAYLRKLARGPGDDEDEDEGEDNEDELPSATMVRVFRLVNGNLEIPSTLFKALATAGRIQDSFFPDEPETWQPPPQAHLQPQQQDIESEYGGTQTDVVTVTDMDDGDGDDDSDVVLIDRSADAPPPVDVDERVRQATAQFLQQMQAIQGGGGTASGGGMDFQAFPEIVRMLGGHAVGGAAAAGTAALGSHAGPGGRNNNLALSASWPWTAAGMPSSSSSSSSSPSHSSPAVVICPIPMMIMPMVMPQSVPVSMPGTGMGMDAMRMTAGGGGNAVAGPSSSSNTSATAKKIAWPVLRASKSDAASDAASAASSASSARTVKGSIYGSSSSRARSSSDHSSSTDSRKRFKSADHASTSSSYSSGNSSSTNTSAKTDSSVASSSSSSTTRRPTRPGRKPTFSYPLSKASSSATGASTTTGASSHRQRMDDMRRSRLQRLLNLPEADRAERPTTAKDKGKGKAPAEGSHRWSPFLDDDGELIDLTGF